MVSSFKIISQPLISLVGGKIIGIIKNIEIKKMKIASLIAFNDESEHGEEFVVPVKNIFSFGENAVTLRGENDITVLSNENPSHKLLGSEIYSQSGERKGNITDIIFNEKNFAIETINSGNKKYISSEIGSLQDGICLLKGTAKILKARNPASIKNIKKAQNLNVTVLNGEIKVSPTAVMQNQEETENIKILVNNEISSPEKITASHSFLIGRIMIQNLLFANGKTLLKRGDVVDTKALEKVIASGNLKFLIANSIPV